MEHKNPEKAIINEIRERNPWWAAGVVEFKELVIERSIFKEILKLVEERETICLTGLRRVGKTTLMLQLVDHLVNCGVPPKRILYFSFDKPVFQNRDAIDGVISFYLENILKETLIGPGEKIYVFFDEIQKVNNWSEEIKNIYDKTRKIKFIISGSSALNILSGSGESLVGRIFVKKVFPFTFREYLKTDNVNMNLNINYIPASISYKEMKTLYQEVMLNEDKIKLKFNDYADLGGFPEILLSKNKELAIERARSWIYFTLFKDIVDVFKIKRPDVLENLLIYISTTSGQTANYAKMASRLNVKYDTVKKYLYYLDQTFLINTSRYFSKSAKKIEKNEKIYTSDHGILNLFWHVEEGLKIETMVSNFSRVVRYMREGDERISYWREKEEVDIVLEINEEIIPIEVKYQNKIARRDIKGIITFMEKFKIKKGIVVTKDLFKEEGDILFIPAWLFVLSV